MFYLYSIKSYLNLYLEKMNKLKLTCIIIILLSILPSCKSYYLNKYCVSKTVIQIDSIHDTTIIVNSFKQIDTVKVIVKSTELNVNLGNPCDSTGKLKDGQLIKLKNGNSRLELIVKNGELVLDTYQDSIVNLTTSLKETKDSMLFYKEKININNSQTLDKTKNLSKWQQFKITGWFDLLIILVILLKIYLTLK